MSSFEDDSDDEAAARSREAWGLDLHGRPIIKSIDITEDIDRGSRESGRSVGAMAWWMNSIGDYDVSEEGDIAGGQDLWMRKEVGGSSSTGKKSSSNPKKLSKKRRPSTGHAKRPRNSYTPSPHTSPSPPPSPPSSPPPPPSRPPRQSPAADRLPRQRMVTTAASVFIEKYVDQASIPGVALVNPAGINRALALRKDPKDNHAGEHIKLLHTVDRRLRDEQPRGTRYEIRWPEWLNLNQKTIAQLRSIYNQGPRREEYTGIRECVACADGQLIMDMEVTCLSDPIERDGCFPCRTHGNQRRCSQRMDKANSNFVFSKLRHSTAERAAVDMLAGSMEEAISLVRELQDETNHYPAPTPLTVLATSLLPHFLSPAGIEVTGNMWEQSRLEVGAENGTRIGDEAWERTTRKLDEDEPLVWSMRAVIKAEVRAFEQYDAACKRAQIDIDTIGFDLLTGPPLPLPSATIVNILERIVRLFDGHNGIKRTRGVVATQRAKLGQVQRRGGA